MKKTIVYLDMDGTIANLYGIENWLQRLINEDETIFTECEPLITMEELFEYFPIETYEVRILSMTPKNATRKYCESVEKQKDAWLDKFFPNITTRIYMEYGDNKNLKNPYNKILIDDNETIRNNFKGLAYYPMWL